MKKHSNLKHITLKQTAIAAWEKYALKPLFRFKNHTFSIIRRMKTIPEDNILRYKVILQIVLCIEAMD